MKQIFALLLFCATANAQELKVVSIGDFVLDNGDTIRDCRIGYRTYGQRDGNNTIVVTTWFAGSTASLGSSIGPGKLFDSSRFFIVAIDALGDGVSSSPSNSVAQGHERFPHFTIADMVRTQHALLTRELQIDHVYAVAGLSMGGMQVLQWMASYPAFMDKAVAITGTPKQTSFDLLFWKTELEILESKMESPMTAIAHINSMHLSTPARIASETKPDAIDAYMKKRDEELRKLDPLDYTSQLRAVIAHDIYRGSTPDAVVASFRAKLLVIVSLQDHMVNPGPARELARIAKAELVTLSGDCGHVAAACEAETVQREVWRFLAR